jgi:hypothetical protein
MTTIKNKIKSTPLLTVILIISVCLFGILTLVFIISEVIQKPVDKFNDKPIKLIKYFVFDNGVRSVYFCPSDDADRLYYDLLQVGIFVKGTATDNISIRQFSGLDCVHIKLDSK